jgi:hypothetical protein
LDLERSVGLLRILGQIVARLIVIRLGCFDRECRAMLLVVSSEKRSDYEARSLR